MKEAKVHGLTMDETTFGSGVKRFYLPATIDVSCPECGEHLRWDGQKDYLDYPDFFGDEQIYFECSNGHESYVSVTLKIQLELQ